MDKAIGLSGGSRNPSRRSQQDKVTTSNSTKGNSNIGADNSSIPRSN
jgi:hypothetical protein